eukprot:CAMPEP_0119052214 /NCGR_PEP_ID=MMETSP1177-20130426/73588_1 /TAXON_ID=2985 /ORGANISM="Ochromonas sp, Strain CCMP1899" /LENGTH=652 /DNA_ID=CAMNT_0007031713 /DNA_START=1455 /DNA_END=3410 /DNA_ORIENTATION=-
MAASEYDREGSLNIGFNVLRHITDECYHSGLSKDDDLKEVRAVSTDQNVRSGLSKEDDLKGCTSSSPSEVIKTQGEGEDILLTHYLLALLGLNERTSLQPVLTLSNIHGILLLQHLETRLLRVRDKPSKVLLQKHVTHSFSIAMQTVHSELGNVHNDMMPYARSLMKVFLHSVNTLELNGKQDCRMVSTLFEGMDSWRLKRADVFDEILFPEILSAEPGLDILKEMHKMFCLLNTEVGRATMSGVLLSLLENDKEKLVKIVIYMLQQNLFSALSSIQLERLEGILVLSLRNCPDGSWSAVMSYLNGAEVCHEACIRLVRGLLSPLGGLHYSLSFSSHHTRHSVNGSVSGSGVTEDEDLNIVTARRLLCKYELTDNPEFRTLFTSFREREKSEALNTSISEALLNLDVKNETDIAYLPSSYPRSNIVWVDGTDMRLIQQAREILLCPTESLGSSDPKGATVLGIDCEWRPYSGGSVPTLCSLLQVACRTHVLLFDLIALEQTPIIDSETAVESAQPSGGLEPKAQPTGGLEPKAQPTGGLEPHCEVDDRHSVNVAFSDLLMAILRSPTIIKVGFGLYGDFKRLLSSFPASKYYEFSSVENVYDLSNVAFCKGKSLSTVSLELLGMPLDKRSQVSDWQKRPLSEDQIIYGATDA